PPIPAPMLSRTLLARACALVWFGPSLARRGDTDHRDGLVVLRIEEYVHLCTDLVGLHVSHGENPRRLGVESRCILRLNGHQHPHLWSPVDDSAGFLDVIDR